ncbi:MAG: sigma-54-dependent Fis family transcriptional regulator [Syntrophaceae bacterium]|jgi:two-component system nitrogen regulation response regulator GlnG|nr:sigma-54-dependent Fis family transcriptional regulator [Syntrophaceae bacterium]
MNQKKARILIVDDDKGICMILSDLMKKEGFEALTVYDGEKALKTIQSESPDLLLVDMMLPGMDGMEVLKKVRELDQELPVVFITAHADSRGAVKAIKAGAHDYLSKPFDNNEVIRVVHRALAERELKLKVRDLSNQLKGSSPLQEKMGPSDAVSRLVSEVNRVAQSDFTVIIIGETGSGKEVVARAIYDSSSRAKGPFIPVDCGAIPETLLESELFGHERGAFTGAEIQKPGKFEVAQGGTIFLDEISNMPLGSQAKLLRVLQEKKVYRVGGNKPIQVDVRLLVASNQDLHELALSGSFRRDLFYRLNEFTIYIPPLRERKEDIPYLAKRFLDNANKELSKQIKGFSESAINVLFNYNWPGNVRQLRSIIRRAALLADDLITEKHLELKRVDVPGMAFTPKVQGAPWKNLSLKEILQQSITAVEREVLDQVLKQTGGNKAKAARLLQIDYKTIHEKVKKLGIQIDTGRSSKTRIEPGSDSPTSSYP